MKNAQNIAPVVTPSRFERKIALKWKEAVIASLPANVVIIEVDMAGTQSIDSNGLAALAGLIELLAKRNGVVRLINPTAAVTGLIEATSLHRACEIARGTATHSSTPQRPILVVDDEQAIHIVAMASLKPLGREIIFAENGIEGLEIALNAAPTIIVLDYAMPLMNGNEMFHRLKAVERTRDIPVIVVSGNSWLSDGDQPKFEGASCFMAKPFSPAALRGEVHHLSQEHERAQPGHRPKTIAFS